MRKLSLLILVLVMSITAMAQNLQDVVYLKNGSVVRGTLIEQVPSVKIRTADGSIWIFEDDKVLKVTSEPKQEPATVLNVETSVFNNREMQPTHQGARKKEKPYYNLSSGIRMLAGITYQQRINIYSSTIWSVDVSMGLQVTPQVYVGLGLADQIYFDHWYYGYNDPDFMPVSQMPVFMHARYDFVPTKKSPMVDFRFGYSLTNDEYVDYSGMYMNPAVGFRYGRSTFSLGIEMVKLQYPYSILEYNAIKGYQMVDINWQRTIQFRYTMEWGGRK